MKRLIFILLFIPFALNATTWYVAPTTATPAGNDANAGTIAAPWATWGKAFTSASVVAGDTVLFRGGVYPSGAGKNGYSLTKSGTITDTIFFLNYPSEVPILDCDDQPIVVSNTSIGVTVKNNSYVKLKGLTIRNVMQYDTDDEAYGLVIQNASHIVVENCIVHNIHGAGNWAYVCDELYYINCDSYNNVDSLTTALPGNDGYGFMDINWINTTSSVYYRYCRAWNNGDDGFQSVSYAYTEYEGCWAFRNGILQGAGNGFKMGWINNATAPLNRLYKNNVAAYNRYKGWTTNDQDYLVGVLNVYNNTAYHNGYQDYHNPVHGFYIENTALSDEATETARRIFKNNLAYDNEDAEVYAMSGAGWTHTYNSWDTPPGVTITDADFVSVDSTGITAARQADGSLPDNDCYNYFLRIADGSELIDAGTDVGLDYNGAAPDLGAFEYDADPAATGTDILTFTLADQTGAATINATTHTVAIEVDYTATITSLTPTITLSYGATVIPLSGVARDFTSPLPYTVTAEDGVTVQEWTVTVTQESAPEEPTDGGKIVKFRGNIVKR